MISENLNPLVTDSNLNPCILPSEAKMIRAAIAVLLLATPLFGESPKVESALASNPVYQQNCAKCHGKAADGRFMAGPSLASDKVVNTSDDELRNIITRGRHHMPKFDGKLSAEEIDKLVFQIKARRK